MRNHKHILVITDNENSELVRIFLRYKFIPITRGSIVSAMDFLHHMEIFAIVFDIEHQNVDTLELILNVRDMSNEIPIFIPEQYQKKEKWDIVATLGKIKLYNEKHPLLQNEFSHFIKSI